MRKSEFFVLNLLFASKACQKKKQTDLFASNDAHEKSQVEKIGQKRGAEKLKVIKRGGFFSKLLCLILIEFIM